MLALDSPRWKLLRHSYSSYRGCEGASNVPAMLRQLETAPDEDAFLGAWYDLLEAVYREGWEFHSASYAVVPYLIRLCETASVQRQSKLLLAVGWIEEVRVREAGRGKLPQFPEAQDLAGDYHAAIKQVPLLIARCAREEWDPDTGLNLAAALLLTKQLPQIAEGVLRLGQHVIVACHKCGEYVEMPRPKGLA